MKKAVLYVLLASLSLAASAQTMISNTFLVSLTKTQLDSTLSANGIPAAFLGTTYGVNVYKVVYNTVSYDSTGTTASGLVAFPIGLDCKLPIVSYAHSPTGNREFVPSRLAGQEALIALVLGSNGNIAISPDYLGMGDSPGKHPFMHAKSEATASIDLVRAARELADTVGVQKNGEVLFSGYSQGGQAAMAAHKLAQEKLAGEIDVTASFPMSGPYSMSGVTMPDMLTNPQYPEPAFLASIVYSYTKIYSLYDTITEILASPYDTLLPPIFEGSQSMFAISNIVIGPAYSMFKADTIAAWLGDSLHPFRLALKDNDLHNWVPNSTLRMVYCSGDTYLPSANAVAAYTYMLANGAIAVDTQDISPSFDHQGCAQIAILATKEHLDDNANIDCQTGIKPVQATKLLLFPNPAQNTITIQNMPEAVYAVELYSTNGQRHTLSLIGNTFDISYLPSGLYSLRLITDTGTFTSRFIKN